MGKKPICFIRLGILWFLVIIAMMYSASLAQGQVYCLKGATTEKINVKVCTPQGCYYQQQDQPIVYQGTAVCIGKMDGWWYFLTADHCTVSESGDRLKTFTIWKPDVGWKPCEFVAGDSTDEIDLALVRLKNDDGVIPYYEIASEEPEINTPVQMRGYPCGVWSGTVNTILINKTKLGFWTDKRVKQGFSGGSVTYQNKLIGIVACSELDGPAPPSQRRTITGASPQTKTWANNLTTVRAFLTKLGRLPGVENKPDVAPSGPNSSGEVKPSASSTGTIPSTPMPSTPLPETFWRIENEKLKKRLKALEDRKLRVRLKDFEGKTLDIEDAKITEDGSLEIELFVSPEKVK